MPDDTASKDAIRAALKRFELTQKDLAGYVDAKPNAISLWLDGKMTSRRLDAAIPAFIRGLVCGSTRAA